MPRAYTLTERQAALAFETIKSHIASTHNYIASAIERGDICSAQELVGELREHQAIFAKLNVEAHKLMDELI